MEDIEDIVGGDGGAPPGFRLPLTSVGLNPKQQRTKNRNRRIQESLTTTPSPAIPGTQTIYMKTFGCSHNQSDSEYMAGQLSAFGYALSDEPDKADLWLINTCTVKSPSQSAMDTLILKCKSVRKPLVVAGCVPQGSKNLKELEGVSIVGVQQIDRVVEVVEETLKGHEVRLLTRKTLPALDLPKVRKNKFIEILPINVGCLGACTYCKTKHARGHLGSYTVESLVDRVRTVVADGVKEIWLSSEDTGAYGRDIGVNLPILLNAIIEELPSDRSTMLRIGMTNPPFILEHLNEIAKALRHPCVYSFLHVPVQAGSDPVLTAMNREYTVGEFRTVVDTLYELVPGMQIATDIICGFPGETDEDFAQTVSLIQEYKFPQVHISQFYPRPGTPAARMKKVPSTVVKRRSRELTTVFESFTPYQGMEGRVERMWITEIATDGIHLVGHTKGYVQVLVIAPESMLGMSTQVKITSVGRWSVFGEVIDVPTPNKEETRAPERKTTNRFLPCSELYEACPCSKELEPDRCVPCSNLDGACPGSKDPCSNLDGACPGSKEPEPCPCTAQSFSDQTAVQESIVTDDKDKKSKTLKGWVLRKRKEHVEEMDTQNEMEVNVKKESIMKGRSNTLAVVDWALLGGMLVSLLTIIALLLFPDFRMLLVK